MCPKFQATAECHGTKPCKDGNQHCRLAPCNDEKDRDEDKDKKEQNQNQNPEGSPSAEAPAAGGGGGVAGAATGGGAAAGGGGGGAMLAVLGGVAAAASGIALGSALGGGGGDESDDCPSALDLAAQSGGAVIAIGDETICTPWTSCGSRSFRACIANYCSPNSCELYYDLSDGRSVTCSFNCGTGDTSGIYSCAERAAVACE